MRAFHAIGAASLMIWALPATSHAAAATDAGALSAPAAPGCHCPPPQHRHVWHRHWRGYAWHRRGVLPTPVAMAAPWPTYNPPIPSPLDGAYDRVMTQYTLARERSGEYLTEPPYVPRPPLPGLPHFRIASGGRVFEYDIMADGYVQIAQREAPRVPVAPTP